MKYAVLLLALMFVGCGSSTDEGSSTDGGYEMININGKSIQVATSDALHRMNWVSANNFCNNLGNGWRLPSMEELEAMYEQLHLKGKGNFKRNSYWSSEDAISCGQWCVDFWDGGSVIRCHSNEEVRAVRTLP